MSDAKSRETAATEREVGPDTYDPDTVRKWLPSNLTDDHTRVLICAVRNPDASQRAIADASGVDSRSSVANALTHLVWDLDAAGGQTNEWIGARGGEARTATAYDELTDKQQVVVDWLARHPEAYDADTKSLTKSGRIIADAINHDDRYTATIHGTYPYTFTNSYASAADDDPTWVDLVDQRRERLAARGELDGDDEIHDDLSRRTVREYLSVAGLDDVLPDSNIDGLQGPREAQSEGTTETNETRETREDAREQSENDTMEATPDTTNDESDDAGGTDDDETREADALGRDESVFSDPEAIEDAVRGLKRELDEVRSAVETLRESAVTPDELADAQPDLDHVERRLDALTEAVADATGEDTRVPHDHEFAAAVSELHQLNERGWDQTEYHIDWKYGAGRVTIEVEAKEDAR